WVTNIIQSSQCPSPSPQAKGWPGLGFWGKKPQTQRAKLSLLLPHLYTHFILSSNSILCSVPITRFFYQRQHHTHKHINT
ncbi:unnamed protein product, partial [Prunus brigantina]